MWNTGIEKICSFFASRHSCAWVAVKKKKQWQNFNLVFQSPKMQMCRSQWPRGLRRRSAAARLPSLRVRIPPGAWMSLCCECCVLSGRGPCDELITRPEDSYRLWCVVVRDLETSWMRRPWPTGSCRAKNKQQKCTYNIIYWWISLRTITFANSSKLVKETMKGVTKLVSYLNVTFCWNVIFLFFDVLLIVHLSIILAINQLNAQILVL